MRGKGLWRWVEDLLLDIRIWFKLRFCRRKTPNDDPFTY